jgi:hypothetical protein
MKKLIVLMAVCFNAHAVPFYFYTGLGGAGSFDRGPEHEVAEFGFGVEVYDNGLFGLDLELGYTTGGNVKGRPITLASNDPTPPRDFFVVIEDPAPVPPPKPVEIKMPGVTTLFNVPRIVVNIPIPMGLPTQGREPEPEPVEPEPVETDVAQPGCDDDFCYEPPACDSEMCFSAEAKPAPPVAKPPVVTSPVAKPPVVTAPAPSITTATPSISNDIFSISVNPKIKVNDFIWLNLRFGADKKMTDGEVKQQQIDPQSRTIKWYNDTHFSDDTLTYHVGVGSIFKFRKKLRGYVKGDWYDLNDAIEGNDFQTDDVIVTAGLRFLF